MKKNPWLFVSLASVLLATLVLSTTAWAAPGTVKLLQNGVEAQPSNEPRLGCGPFRIEFFFGEPNVAGSWDIESWPPTGNGTVVLSGMYLTESSGYYLTGYLFLPTGHYKLFWQEDAHQKMKVFWVDCPTGVFISNLQLEMKCGSTVVTGQVVLPSIHSIVSVHVYGTIGTQGMDYLHTWVDVPWDGHIREYFPGGNVPGEFSLHVRVYDPYTLEGETAVFEGTNQPFCQFLPLGREVNQFLPALAVRRGGEIGKS